MSEADVPIRWAAGGEDLRGALALRERVFCGEQGVPRGEETDGLDERALHLVALEPGGGRVIATLRLLVGEGVAGEGRAKVGRVAVDRAWRRRGIASRMLDMALAAARGGPVRVAT